MQIPDDAEVDYSGPAGCRLPKEKQAKVLTSTHKLPKYAVEAELCAGGSSSNANGQNKNSALGGLTSEDLLVALVLSGDMDAVMAKARQRAGTWGEAGNMVRDSGVDIDAASEGTTTSSSL